DQRRKVGLCPNQPLPIVLLRKQIEKRAEKKQNCSVLREECEADTYPGAAPPQNGAAAIHEGANETDRGAEQSTNEWAVRQHHTAKDDAEYRCHVKQDHRP